MSSYPSSTCYTSEKSAAALNVLSNFGLEINDLALLADLPEDLITAESLPRLLMEIKANRMAEENTALTVTSRPTTSSSASSSPQAAVSSATQSLSNLLKQIRSQPVQYPLDHAYLSNKPASPPASSHKTTPIQPTIKTQMPTPAAQPYSRSMFTQSPVLSHSAQVMRDLAIKNNPTTSAHSSLLPNSGRTSVLSHPSHAQISQFLAKSTWGSPANTGLVPYNSSSGGGRSYVGTTGYGYAVPSYSGISPVDYHYPEHSTAIYKSTMNTTPAVPPIKAARDFYGQKPPGYPYTCSLCHTTAYTETYWVGHVNEQRHSDGQLQLLQKFPDWDCRIETVRNVAENFPTHGEQHSSQTKKKKKMKNVETEAKEKKMNNEKREDKVVCVKFARDSVCETSLKSLVKPFGEVVEFDLYHEFAFLEMRSAKEAKDTVEYFLKSPLMNSNVIRFCPIPSGKKWFRELMATANRFGPVINHYFLPTQAFLEMSNPKDANKLVEHYSSAPLIIEEETVKVALSTEYLTLKAVCSPNLPVDELRVKKRRIRSPHRKSYSPTRRVRSPKRRDSISNSQSTSKSREKQRKREENKTSTERRKTPHASSTHRPETSSAKPAPSIPSKPAAEQITNQAGRIQAPPTSTSEPACIDEGISTDPEKALASCDTDSDMEGIEVIWADGENLDYEAMETVDETDGDEEDKEDGFTETDVPEKKLEEQGGEIMAKVSEPPEQTTSGFEILHSAHSDQPPASGSEPLRDEEEQRETPAEKDKGIKKDLKKEESKEEAPVQPEQIQSSEMTDAAPPVQPAVRGSEPNQDSEAQGDICQKEGQKITRARKVESAAALNCEQNVGRTTRSSRRNTRLQDTLDLMSKTSPRVVLIKSSFNKEKKSAKRDSPSKNAAETENLSPDTTHKEKEDSAIKSIDKDVSTEKSVEKEHFDQDVTGKEDLLQNLIETSVETFPAKEGSTLVAPKKQETVRKTRKGVASPKKRGKRCNSRPSPAKGKLSKGNAEAGDLKESTEVEKDITKPNKNTECANVDGNEDTGKAEINKQTENADKDQITGYSLKDSPFEVGERLTSPSEEQPAQPGTDGRTEPQAEINDEPMPEEDLETGTNHPQTAIHSPAEVTDSTLEKLIQQKPEEKEKVGSFLNTVLDSREPTKDAAYGAEHTSEVTPILLPEKFGPEEYPLQTSMDLSELSDPVGTEFVRPVVGFFCNLCKVIYADEDEAKQKHCRSLSHFKKFKEHSSKEAKSSS